MCGAVAPVEHQQSVSRAYVKIAMHGKHATVRGGAALFST